MRDWPRRAVFALAAALLFTGGSGSTVGQAATAKTGGGLRIGLILDLAGPYSRVTGQRNATAARMAVEDFGGQALGGPIEVVVADHKNDPDRALAIARDWFGDQHVDAIMDVSGSPEALIVQRYAEVRHKIVIINSAAAQRLSEEACTATSIHYTSDTRAIANTVAGPLGARGDNTWFFITVDYGFGYDLERDTADVIKAHGGTVLGDARHPLGTHDFESYLARAQQSKAKVIALANAGADTDGTVTEAARLGMIPGHQVFAALAMHINAVHALGLKTTEGMMLGDSFYWDMNDATRAWSRRFFDRVKQMPNSLQAGVYSSTMDYLKAVARAGTADTDAVLKVMRETPIDDFFTSHGQIRADGTMVHDMYLFQVKAPSESHYPWDYLKQVATIPGPQAFGPLSQSKCPIVKE